MLYLCHNVKKTFLLKVSSVDSQKMITKYFLGAWQMQKRVLNIIPISSPTLALVAPSQDHDEVVAADHFL